MIGKYTIEIDYKDFLKGMSSSRDLPDGGFSSLTYAINPRTNPGVLNWPALPVNRSTSITDELILTCDDPTYVGKTAMYLGVSRSTGLGGFYTMDGAYALTRQVGTASAKFSAVTSDFVVWNEYITTHAPYFYATTWAGANGDITRWDGSTTVVESWWVGTLAQPALMDNTAWRPMTVFNKYLFIGDKNKLHRVTPSGPAVAGSVSNSIITFPIDETISAMGIDKGSGLLMIATTRGVDANASRNSISTIYLYDGFSATWSRAIPMNGTVTAFKQLDDRTIVFVGDKMGYFTGSGVKFMRQMTLVDGNQTKLVYPAMAVVVENTLYYREGSKIIAYGEIASGNKVFYPIHANEPSGTPVTVDILSHVGRGIIAYGYDITTSKLYSIDTTSVATITTQIARFYTNKFKFPRPVFIRSAYIEWYDGVANTVEASKLYAINEKYEITAFSSLQNTTGATIYSMETNSLDLKGRMFQFMVSPCDTGVIAGIVRIVISYDVAE